MPAVAGAFPRCSYGPRLLCLHPFAASQKAYQRALPARASGAGVVAVWDVATSALVLEYEAHSKRIWSLDYCAAAHPALLASASDDCTVKLWSPSSPNSVGQVRASGGPDAVQVSTASLCRVQAGAYGLWNTAAPSPLPATTSTIRPPTPHHIITTLTLTQMHPVPVGGRKVAWANLDYCLPGAGRLEGQRVRREVAPWLST